MIILIVTTTTTITIIRRLYSALSFPFGQAKDGSDIFLKITLQSSSYISLGAQY